MVDVMMPWVSVKHDGTSLDCLGFGMVFGWLVGLEVLQHNRCYPSASSHETRGLSLSSRASG